MCQLKNCLQLLQYYNNNTVHLRELNDLSLKQIPTQNTHSEADAKDYQGCSRVKYNNINRLCVCANRHMGPRINDNTHKAQPEASDGEISPRDKLQLCGRYLTLNCGEELRHRASGQIQHIIPENNTSMVYIKCLVRNIAHTVSLGCNNLTILKYLEAFIHNSSFWF